MTTRHFCTYFDYNYLPRGMVMLESLHAHCPHAIVHVLCISEECHTALAAINYPFVQLIPLTKLEEACPELLEVRPTRSLVEYYFTLTPCLPWYLLHSIEAIDAITYLDADMMFFSSPEPIFKEAGNASVILTPHKFSKYLQHLIVWGIYNVSWLTFYNTPDGLEALDWYRKSCLEWCYDKLEGDRFADQKYLDQFPTLFKNVHVIQHAGGGLAPWNIADAHVQQAAHQVMVGKSPLIFYHAHGFKHILGSFWASGLLNYQAKVNKPTRTAIFLPYAKNLLKCTSFIKNKNQIKQFTPIRYSTQHSLVMLIKALYAEWLHNTLILSR